MTKKSRESMAPEKIEQELSPEDNAFRAVMKDRLIRLYAQELRSAGAAAEAVEEFRQAMSDLADWEEFSGMISWPLAIRQGLIKQLSQLSGQEMVEALRDRLVSFEGYNRPRPQIGFHTTGAEIKPEKNKQDRLTWDIKGQETSDLAEGRVAYAADRFSGLYHDKESNNFYVVRIMDDEGRYDANQGWYQAPFFSIIAKFDTEDIYRQIDEKLAQSEKLELVAAT